MSGCSTYLANKIVDGTLPSVTAASPASKYLALFFADPTDDNITTNEVSGAWYARIGSGAWSAAVSGMRANSDTLSFAAITGSAVTVSHWGIYDAAASGNLLYSGEFPEPMTFNVGAVPTALPGDLEITYF